MALTQRFLRKDESYKDPQLVALREKLEASLKELKGGVHTTARGRRGGSSGRAKLASILGLRVDSPFSERIVDFFYAGEEFSVELIMDWVELILSKGNYEHKARFIFFVYDLQEEGALNEQAIRDLLQLIIKENKFVFKPASAEILTQALFAQFGEFLADGVVTEQEFITFCKDYPSIMDDLTIGKLSNRNWKSHLSYTTSTNTIAEFLNKKTNSDRRQMPWGRRLYYKWQLEGWKYTLILIWLSVTFSVWYVEFQRYNTELNYKLSGYAIPTAKSAGATLRLNCHLLLLPVCKRLTTWVRGVLFNLDFVKYFQTGSDYRRPHGPTWLWDKHISFHKRIAFAVCVAVPVHVVAHFYNVVKLAAASDELIMNDHYNWCCGEGSYFERFSFLTERPTIAHLLFLTVPGWTGWLLLIVLGAMTWAALAKNRSKNYEKFFYTHYMMVFFYVFLIVHGSTHLVASPRFWMWSLAFVTLYGFNTFLRVKTMQRVDVVSAKVDPQTKWIALELKRPPGWDYRTGSYAMLNVPEISKVQFHPFTLSSTPESRNLGFHIKSAGDWTSSLQNLMKRSDGVYPEVIVEGPYASAAEYVFDYDVCLLFCAGVGVTPYASILETIKERQMKKSCFASSGAEKPPPNIYFYWTCRDQFSFAWFGGLFGELLKVKPQEAIQPITDLSHPIYPTDRFKLNLFMTGALPQGDITNTILQMSLDSVYEKTNTDLITGISDSGQTRFGRPNVEAIFEEMIDTYPGKEIGVFVCGPRPLCQSIHTFVMNKTGKRGTVFRYFKEVF